MKLAIVLAISLIVIGCKDKIKGGYCVGKEYSPEHYESVAHSHMIGKVITTYYTRQKVKSKFKVGIANMHQVQIIDVDSLSYNKYEKGKYYIIK